jgi:hypothetical protein
MVKAIWLKNSLQNRSFKCALLVVKFSDFSFFDSGKLNSIFDVLSSV